ncbi:hypothetical protein V1517DRAFT_311303 [Lipomyces orientalis]|uniref:Uncharacterized protein n=1 Tax=Lipomyces orientalis TaxID=1233043 RepID=A0ACC3TCA5_9ASCO
MSSLNPNVFSSRSFDDTDAHITAEREIRNLRQGNGHCTYLDDFHTHRGYFEFRQASKIYEFRSRLHDEVHDLLISRDVPSDYNDFVRLFVALDNVWLARQQTGICSVCKAAPIVTYEQFAPASTILVSVAVVSLFFSGAYSAAFDIRP